jgi:transposase
MARYKAYDLKQTKMIALSYADQLVEGSFEHALNELVENHLDLRPFEARYANDETGRPAYDPRLLLKVVLYGYYKGVLSSRAVAEACRRNVVFMALSADSQPHFTTIAAFVSELDREIVGLFRDVLLYASELGLIGKEHFAVDGCKLPSNASKRWSGTHRELEEKRKKLEQVAERIVERHRERDGQEEAGSSAKDAKKVERHRRKIEQIKAFLARKQKKVGPSGQEQKSNLTDPESAKMTSSRGVLQGYNGLAVVDEKAQIVVHSEAHGSGYEGHLLAPLLEATRETFQAIEPGRDVFQKVKVTADSGFHSRVVVAEVERTGADAYIADRDYRRRDPAFASAGRHKERERKERARERAKKAKEAAEPAKPKPFSLQDFFYDEGKALCICPAGHKLYRSGKHLLFNGYRVAHFKAPMTACRGCSLRTRCLRHPERTPQRTVCFIKGREGPRTESKNQGAVERMRFKFDTAAGRALYSRRMGTVEPVFGNLQNKGMRRFTLRGRRKVNAQWQLFTMVHNIEKIAFAARGS